MKLENIALAEDIEINEVNDDMEIEECEEDRIFIESIARTGMDDFIPSLTIYFQDLARHGEILSRASTSSNRAPETVVPFSSSTRFAPRVI